MKEITIKIEGKEWEEAMDKAFQKANKNAKIDGFRPGKAPKDIFIKKYGYVEFKKKYYYRVSRIHIKKSLWEKFSKKKIFKKTTL